MLLKVSWLMLVSCISMTGVYAQRVYATTEQHSAKQMLTVVTLSEVQNPGNSVDAVTTNSTTLVTYVGALSLIEAWQNLQFTGSIEPNKYSPIIIRMSAGGSSNVLNLLGSVKVDNTYGGGSVKSYSGSSLLDLLGLFSVNTPVDLVVPAPLVDQDGVRLLVTSTLGIAVTAQYYYAFFITPPAITNKSVCTGQATTLTVTNPQSGYQYAWFESQTGGTAVSVSGTGSYTTPVLTSAKSYYVEAREGTTSYASSRTKVDVSIYSKPVTPLVQLNH